MSLNHSRELLPAVSSTLKSLAESRKVEYNCSSIQLVDLVENKYPLTDIIMSNSTGTRVNGNLEGEGSANFNNGNLYQGNFKKGVMHGKGKYVWKDNVIYEGDFKECKITGNGTYTWPDGSKYVGDVLNGKRHGTGVYHCAHTGGIYTGSWVCGAREGRGYLMYKGDQLSFYDGEWVANQMQGYGVRKYRSGNMYEGEWHANQREGQGTMSWWDRGEEYSGEWKKGLQNGHGEHIWRVNGTDNAQYPVYNRYVGEWKNGVREGKGTFYYASGAVYSGEWVDNKKHGHGRFVFQSGRVYDGQFNADTMVNDGDNSLSAERDNSFRPKTPLGSLIGDIDSSDRLNGDSITEKFNIEIHRVIPPLANKQQELKQVHCVLLRFITQLKTIYHLYSSLGCSETDNPQHIMTRLQLWRLLKDCKLHHLGFTLYEMDIAIDPDSEDSTAHNPDTTFLMREFLQSLVFLANYIYVERGFPTNHPVKDTSSGQLAAYLSELLSVHILPLAGSLEGPLFGQGKENTRQALSYKDSIWRLFECIQSKSTKKVVTIRDILFLLQDCGKITEVLTAARVTSLLVSDDPLAYNEGCYNTELKVVFLEFFEALLVCAVLGSSDQHRVSITITEESSDIDHTTTEGWNSSLGDFLTDVLSKAKFMY